MQSGFFKDAISCLSLHVPFMERPLLVQAYTVLLVMFIAMALVTFPYNVYTIARLVVCIALVIFYRALQPQRAHRQTWMYILIGLVILYNPIFEIHFGDKLIWTVVNFATLYYLYCVRRIIDRDTTAGSETPPNTQDNSSD